ncbi:MAG: hypothetical protein ACMG6E_03175 [Candidatus Roizmanbacteria bacterium]
MAVMTKFDCYDVMEDNDLYQLVIKSDILKTFGPVAIYEMIVQELGLQSTKDILKLEVEKSDGDCDVWLDITREEHLRKIGLEEGDILRVTKQIDTPCFILTDMYGSPIGKMSIPSPFTVAELLGKINFTLTTEQLNGKKATKLYYRHGEDKNYVLTDRVFARGDFGHRGTIRILFE